VSIFVNSFWSICPSSEMSYISKATASRSSRSPWLVAEIARRNSSKSIVPSSFESNVSKAYLEIQRLEFDSVKKLNSLTCRNFQLCLRDRIGRRLVGISSCQVCQLDNHEENPRKSNICLASIEILDEKITWCHWRISIKRTK